MNVFFFWFLEGVWFYFWLDVIYFKVWEGGCIISKVVIIVVVVNEDGKCEVLGVVIGLFEVEIFWIEFLWFLVDWGLCGVKLVIVDDYKGLWVVVCWVFNVIY